MFILLGYFLTGLLAKFYSIATLVFGGVVAMLKPSVFFNILLWDWNPEVCRRVALRHGVAPQILSWVVVQQFILNARELLLGLEFVALFQFGPNHCELLVERQFDLVSSSLLDLFFVTFGELQFLLGHGLPYLFAELFFDLLLEYLDVTSGVNVC